jgi:hypothetical protein
VSVDTFDGAHLPYADDLVRLVVAEELGDVARDAVLQVLATADGAVECFAGR